VPQKCTSVVKYGHARFTPGAVSGLAGTYATHALLRAGTAIVAVPDAVPDAVAAPANCALATVCAAWRAAVKAVAPAPVRRVLIQGCGLLGLYACALAARRGAAAVVATDVSPDRRALAGRFGATTTVDAAAPDAAAQVAAADGGGGYDAVLEVCGVASAVAAGVSAVRPGGAVVLVGLVHPDSALAGVTGEAIIRKCASVVGVHNYAPEDLEDAVAFLAATVGGSGGGGGGGGDGAPPYADVTSPPFPLDDLPAAVDVARRAAYPRVLLKP
jgi:threonine dehydrogenase-like Zn-dependent dehydrogenase